MVCWQRLLGWRGRDPSVRVPIVAMSTILASDFEVQYDDSSGLDSATVG